MGEGEKGGQPAGAGQPASGGLTYEAHLRREYVHQADDGGKVTPSTPDPLPLNGRGGTARRVTFHRDQNRTDAI